MVSGVRKKWTKRDSREKVNNKIFVDISNYEKILKEIMRIKIITPSSLVERFHMTCSASKYILKLLHEQNIILAKMDNAKQKIYKVRESNL